MPGAESDTRKTLVRDLKEATQRVEAAYIALKSASKELTAARAAIMKAHIRLNEFLGAAFGPDGSRNRVVWNWPHSWVRGSGVVREPGAGPANARCLKGLTT